MRFGPQLIVPGWPVAAAAVVALHLSLFGCATPPSSPAEQTRFAADETRIDKKLTRVCLGSGLFKLGDGILAAAVPAAELPVELLNAGVDQVCAHPERFAADAASLEWLGRNLEQEIERRRAAQKGSSG